jgi:hypothetical protein
MKRRGCIESLFSARRRDLRIVARKLKDRFWVLMDSNSKIAADRHCGGLLRVKWR